MANQDRQMILYEEHKQTRIQYLRIIDLCKESSLRADLIRRLLNLGLIDPVQTRPEPLFDEGTLLRVRRMLRLHHDLGIGWTSLGLVMDLLDRIHELETENRQLRLLMTSTVGPNR